MYPSVPTLPRASFSVVNLTARPRSEMRMCPWGDEKVFLKKKKKKID